MPKRITSPELRFRFVEGWLTGGVDPEDGRVECGPTTRFPMLVTPKQLAELMYRVKDSRCTDGVVTVTYYSAEDTWDQTYRMSEVVPDAEPIEYENNLGLGSFAFTRRGYVANTIAFWTEDSETFELVPPINPVEEPMPEYDEKFFDAEPTLLEQIYLYYDFPVDIAYRKATHEFAMLAGLGLPVREGFAGPFLPSRIALIDTPQIFFNDIFIKEIESEALPFRAARFLTGFSHTSWSEVVREDEEEDFPVPTIYAIYGSSPPPSLAGIDLNIELELAFSGEVAFIDVTGSGNPLDPGNQLYVGLNFEVSELGNVIFPFGWELNSYVPAERLPDYVELCSLKLKLSGTDQFITCPLYGYFDADYMANLTSTDWIFEAKEWWPSAKNSPSTPVWNTSTGVKL